MRINIHFIFFLLITLLTQNLLSQGSGWEVILEVSYNQGMFDVQFVNSSTGFIVSEDSKIYKSTNGGQNWIIYNHYDPQIHSTFNSLYFLDAQTGFIGGDNGILFKTTNGGINLDTMRMPSPYDALHSIYFPSRDTGYIASKYGGLYKTTNGGANWIIQQLPGGISGFNFEGLFCPSNNIAFAAGNKFTSPYYQICRTTNGGVNWEGIKIDSADWIYNIYFTDINTGYAVGETIKSIPPNGQYYEGLVFKTTNLGINWVLKLADSSSIFRSVYFINQNTGFAAGTNGSSIAKTTNAGENWNINRNYIFWGLWSVYFIDANTGVAAGYNRIIRTTNGGEPIGIKPISSEIPNEFSLSQNYPNPFNPVTKIKFEIPAVKTTRRVVFTKMVVYDLLGKEIQTLVNENLSPGTYEANFDGSNLSSGVYYYKLESGDFTQTRKMVLMK